MDFKFAHKGPVLFYSMLKPGGPLWALAINCLWVLSLVNPVMAEPFAGGYIPEAAEQYNRFPMRPPFRHVLPPNVDLSAHFPPAGRQENQPSCVGWALAYATRTYYEARGRQPHDLRPEPFSPAFIFNQSKIGNCQTGSTISAGLEVLKKQGAAPWSDFPYDPFNCEQQPSSQVLATAKQFRIRDWSRVNTKEVDSLKAELFQGNPIVFGMFVTPAFYRLKSGIFTDTTERVSGGHAMVLVGYDDDVKAFKIFNSWGENWGERGFGWISYATLMARIQNAFVISVDPPSPLSPSLPPERVSSDQSPPPRTDDETLESQIKALKHTLTCSSFSWSQSPAGQIAIQGHVENQKDREWLESWRRQSSLLLSADFSIQVDPWPLCPLLRVINEHPMESQDPKVRVNGQQEVTLYEGDALTIAVDYERRPKYILVLYIQADGSIVVLRNGFKPTDLDSHLGLILGRSPENLSIVRPLGHEAVIVLTAEGELGGKPPFRTIANNPSLRALGQVLQSPSNGNEGVKTPSFGRAMALIHTEK